MVSDGEGEMKQKLMKAWKVICQGGSAWIVGPGARRYQIGRFTHPARDAGPLCAFTTREQAREFKRRVGADHIHRCSIVVSPKTAVWIPSQPSERYDIGNLPHGTILCSAIRLED